MIRQSRPKPQRRVRISNHIHGAYALHLAVPRGRQVNHFGYYLTPIPADFGLGFHVEKFGTEQEGGEPAGYDVLIDARHGFHQCECKGFLRWHHCKHVEATLALIQAGKIAVPEVKTLAPQDNDFDDP